MTENNNNPAIAGAMGRLEGEIAVEDFGGSLIKLQPQPDDSNRYYLVSDYGDFDGPYRSKFQAQKILREAMRVWCKYFKNHPLKVENRRKKKN